MLEVNQVATEMCGQTQALEYSKHQHKSECERARDLCCDAKNNNIIIIIIIIKALGLVWQEPEPSQATGIALVGCILGKFLGLVYHCFPPLLDVPRCLYVRKDARDPSSERWNYGRERLSGNFAYMASLFTPLGIFHMP